jgi:hypothetical protein
MPFLSVPSRHCSLLPSHSPQSIEYAAAHLAAYLFARAAVHEACVVRLRSNIEIPRPLAQAPALRRAWTLITPNLTRPATSAATLCTMLMGEQSIPAQDALKHMEKTAKAGGVLQMGSARYTAERWHEFDILTP